MQTLLFRLIFVALLLLAVQPAQSQTQSSSALPFTLKSLGHNVYAAIDDAKGDAGANAGFVIGENGVLVIDTFENEAAAKQLLAEIRKLTKLPVKYVVNTHYHIDHVAGNGVFQAAGAIVLGQTNIHSWIHTENLKFFGKDIKPDQKSLVEGLAAPDVVYKSGLEIYLGSLRIEVHVLPGHTGGDSVVVIPDADVIFCGDLFWRTTLPNLIDASTNLWTNTLDTLVREPYPLRVFVPGHGDPGDARDVEAFRGYLKDLRAMVDTAAKSGKTGDELLKTVLPALKEKYGQWAFFDYFAQSDILDTAAELAGKKKIPVPAKTE